MQSDPSDRADEAHQAAQPGQPGQPGQPANVELAPLGLFLPGGPWPEASRLARIVPVRWSGDGQVSGVMVL
ncbi:hypothetical protein, partial [Salmonella enterica]|uniref:hypothetical protein n=1 Tax=Salmonella enterica TaxID=28901 RepID=UPI0039E7EEE6